MLLKSVLAAAGAVAALVLIKPPDISARDAAAEQAAQPTRIVYVVVHVTSRQAVCAQRDVVAPDSGFVRTSAARDMEVLLTPAGGRTYRF